MLMPWRCQPSYSVAGTVVQLIVKHQSLCRQPMRFIRMRQLAVVVVWRTWACWFGFCDLAVRLIQLGAVGVRNTTSGSPSRRAAGSESSLARASWEWWLCRSAPGAPPYTCDATLADQSLNSFCGSTVRSSAGCGIIAATRGGVKYSVGGDRRVQTGRDQLISTKVFPASAGPLASRVCSVPRKRRCRRCDRYWPAGAVNMSAGAALLIIHSHQCVCVRGSCGLGG